MPEFLSDSAEIIGGTRLVDRPVFQPTVEFQDDMGDLVTWLTDQEAATLVDQATSALVNRGLAR